MVIVHECSAVKIELKFSVVSRRLTGTSEQRYVQKRKKRVSIAKPRLLHKISQQIRRLLCRIVTPVHTLYIQF